MPGTTYISTRLTAMSQRPSMGPGGDLLQIISVSAFLNTEHTTVFPNTTETSH